MRRQHTEHAKAMEGASLACGDRVLIFENVAHDKIEYRCIVHFIEASRTRLRAINHRLEHEINVTV